MVGPRAAWTVATSPSGTAPPLSGFDDWGTLKLVVGAKGQATRIAKSLALIAKKRKSLRLRGLVYFSWRDGAPYAPDFKDMWGLHTGLLDINGQPKTALDAFDKHLKLFR